MQSIKIPAAQPIARWVASRRYYYTADRMEIVPEGNPAAAFLAAGEGQEMLLSEAVALGLDILQSALDCSALTDALEPEAKAEDAPVENKAFDGPTETKQMGGVSITRKKR